MPRRYLNQIEERLNYLELSLRITRHANYSVVFSHTSDVIMETYELKSTVNEIHTLPSLGQGHLQFSVRTEICHLAAFSTNLSGLCPHALCIVCIEIFTSFLLNPFHSVLCQLCLFFLFIWPYFGNQFNIALYVPIHITVEDRCFPASRNYPNVISKIAGVGSFWNSTHNVHGFCHLIS